MLIFFLFLQTKQSFCHLFAWSQPAFSAIPVPISSSFTCRSTFLYAFSLQVKMNVRHCCFPRRISICCQRPRRRAAAEEAGAGGGAREGPASGEEAEPRRRREGERGAPAVDSPRTRWLSLRLPIRWTGPHSPLFPFPSGSELSLPSCSVRIRIHLKRTQIRFQHFRLNTDPDPIRIYNYLSLGLHKGRPS